MLTPYLVGPQTSGLERNIEPFFLPEQAYSELEDVFIWRGRLKRKFGTQGLGNSLGSRLRVSVGTTDASGNITGTAPGNRFRIGQMFSIGNEVFTSSNVGTPEAMKRTVGSGLATFHTNNGAFVIQGATANTACYFYPSDPVMGIFYRNESGILDQTLIAFDFQFAYTQGSSQEWTRIVESTETSNSRWTGNDTNFFWVTHSRGSNPDQDYLYVTNNKDNIRYLPQGSSEWGNLRRRLNATPESNPMNDRYLETARIILPYRNRLLVFNTREGATEMTAQNYQNRVRWCVNFGDSMLSPIDEDAWYDTITRQGNFLDAPTEESIITVFRLKESLIVYFEKSVWELVYTDDPNLPFRWNNINTNLGSKSTFSVIGFDTAVLAVGANGIHGCDGVNVSRIDTKIPDQVYSFYERTGGLEKSHGIRDFYNQVVYWTYVDPRSPNQSSNEVYPNRILCYNYENETWSIFNESFTCFSYGQAKDGDRWNQIEESWENHRVEWSSSRVFPYQNIIAGNQQGFTFELTRNFMGNAPSLYVTDFQRSTNTSGGFSGLFIIRATDHNVRPSDILRLENAVFLNAQNQPTTLEPTFLKVESLNGKNQFQVSVQNNGMIPTTQDENINYRGGGRIRKITGFKIETKNFNPGTELGKQFAFPYIDFLIDRTESGEITLDYKTDTETTTIYSQAQQEVLLGSNILLTRAENTLFEHANNQQIWHRYFTQTQSQFLQLCFSLSENQLLDYGIANSDFQMHAFLLYAEPQGRLIG